jgi:hypothetical protein
MRPLEGMPSAVRHHAPRGALIGLVQVMGRAELTLPFSGFFCQYVTTVRGVAFESAASGASKSLSRTTVGF